MEFILLFPGQGSQTPGMGEELAEHFPAARDVFHAVDEALGVALSRLCFEGPAEELTLTHNAQPALLAHGAAVWAVAQEMLKGHTVAAAGHSLGEFTAYHAAGAVGLAESARLVRRRGELMYESGTARPGTMAAILGNTSAPIEDICRQATAERGLVVPANYNSPAQVVISGEVAGVERAMELAKEQGAKRAVRLTVSGAFHSPLMEPAVSGLSQALADTHFAVAHFPVYSNVAADAGISVARARESLLQQLTSPVRWTDEVLAMTSAYPGATFVEMGPGSVLTGLLRKIAPDAKGISCGKPEDLEKLHELAAA